jgi:YVTN family beta-propeller protein
MPASRSTRPVAALVIALVLAACSSGGSPTGAGASSGSTGATTSASGSTTPGSSASPVSVVPGMPPVLDPTNIYSAQGVNMLSDAVKGDRAAVYVPNGISNDITVIDPKTLQVIDTYKAGAEPQHIVPSYDLRTLWELNNSGNSIMPIDAKTGTPGTAIPVDDPYNLYFTPDGKSAVVVAEGLARLDYRDPHTMELQQSLPVPQCVGINHADYSIDGSYALFTCEFAAKMAKIDIVNHKVLGFLDLPGTSPQDVRAGPDGKTFYVADLRTNGVYVLDGDSFTQTGFIPTGVGAHGLYPSRDGKLLYVANRGNTTAGNNPPHGEGSVSVVDFATKKVIDTWTVPGGGSPDMGNITADGTQLWLSGRYDDEVYVFDLVKGGLLTRIPVGDAPHGLTVWPQPGRYSLGHTGITR